MSAARVTGVLKRKWRTAMRQPAAVVALVLVAWPMIGLAPIAISILPFRYLAPLLGENRGATSLMPAARPQLLSRAIRIGRAILIAAKYAPFRSDFLPQAIVAAIMCRWCHVPYAAHLGASFSDHERRRGLVAHAWVQCGECVATGDAGNLDRYGVVACFVPRDAAR